MDGNFSWVAATAGHPCRDEAFPRNVTSDCQFVQDELEAFKEGLYKHQEPTTILLISVYIPVFVLSLFGNVLVLVVILPNRHMRSVTNYFLVNLAIADLLVAVICVPLTVGEIVYRVWVYGIVMCKATTFLQGVSVSASVLTITALSLDRYVAIRHPVKSRRLSTLIHVRVVVLVVWMLAICIMAPLLYVRRLEYIPLGLNEYLTMCHEIWPDIHKRRIYDTFLFVFIYVIPGSIVLFSYLSTGCRLIRGSRQLRRQDSEAQYGANIVSGRRRLARMLLLLAILFAIFWMPYYIVMIYIDFTSSSSGQQEALLTLTSFTLLLGHAHSAQNPLVYCLMNRSFNREVCRILKCQGPSENRSERAAHVRRRKHKELQSAKWSSYRGFRRSNSGGMEMSQSGRRLEARTEGRTKRKALRADSTDVTQAMLRRSSPSDEEAMENINTHAPLANGSFKRTIARQTNQTVTVTCYFGNNDSDKIVLSHPQR